MPCRSTTGGSCPHTSSLSPRSPAVWRCALANLPVIRFDEQTAHRAFEAHAALMKAQAGNPKLRENEHWQALCDTARARFLAAFERLS